MQKKIPLIALFLLFSSLAFGQHYYQGETVFPIADAIRDQINKDRQKYTNIKLSEEAEIPIVLNGNRVFMDTLRTILLKDVVSVTLTFDDDKFPYFGASTESGIIIIKTKEEED